MRAHAATARARLKQQGKRMPSLRHALRNRHAEDSRFADTLRDLAEAGGSHELVHLFLRAPAHHPGRSLPVAAQRARDQLELRMPRLARVDEEAAGRDGIGKAAERLAHRPIVRHELVETRDDAERGPRRKRGEARTVESVAMHKTRDPSEPLLADERSALLDVER